MSMPSSADPTDPPSTHAELFPDNPVLVALTRGDAVESFHRGAAIALRADGRPLLAWGDVERPVFPRSALKPMQALALLEALPDAPDLTPERIALHTASHAGWLMQVERIREWLEDMGLSEANLECGTRDWPLDPDAARELARRGGRSGPVHHNCSGQHAGFLRLAQAMGAPTAGYIGAEHPVQRAVTAVLGDLTDVDMATMPHGLEGCGIPSPALPLWAVALGMARLADPSGLAPSRAAAARRLCAAMAAHPDMVAGPGRCETRLIRTTTGRVLAKVGAEGNMVAIIPGHGVGVALKMDDGATRAAEVALGLVLEALGVLSADDRAALAGVFQPVERNAAGVETGHALAVTAPEDGDGDADDPEVDPWDEDWDDEDPKGPDAG
ncbi:asparaginase [Rhodospira trueperi]|uniref:Asparaginase n=1 Tax=Rhodospira trueperi TaxID=69960 RepID=A0A1G7B3T2_9PROT|nr:asparaginase [Rhodospira trueperi]SDE21758.1 asparaginase [Rhodospira trueperi]